MFSDIVFFKPYYFFTLLLLIPLIAWYAYKMHKQDASVAFSTTASLAGHRTWRVYLIHVPFILRALCIILLAIALARPQRPGREESSNSIDGIDIMLAIDVSGTMLADDLDPNRLESAKTVASNFVRQRPNDNIGVVVFAADALTQCPLTTDHDAVINRIQDIRFGMLEDGTAIGTGLATTVSRMKDSPTKSKVVILLTDGSNNRGNISPLTAAEMAEHDSIRVYTIGVGSKGEARIPVSTPFGTQYQIISGEFDENTLQLIAERTGGEYFRANSNTSLQNIYDQIDKLEKTSIRTRVIRQQEEFFFPFLLAALVCLILEIIVRHLLLKSITT